MKINNFVKYDNNNYQIYCSNKYNNVLTYKEPFHNDL